MENSFSFLCDFPFYESQDVLRPQDDRKKIVILKRFRIRVFITMFFFIHVRFIPKLI